VTVPDSSILVPRKTDHFQRAAFPKPPAGSIRDVNFAAAFFAFFTIALSVSQSVRETLAGCHGRRTILHPMGGVESSAPW
jgi:hypothetical protein